MPGVTGRAGARNRYSWSVKTILVPEIPPGVITTALIPPGGISGVAFATQPTPWQWPRFLRAAIRYDGTREGLNATIRSAAPAPRGAGGPERGPQPAHQACLQGVTEPSRCRVAQGKERPSGQKRAEPAQGPSANAAACAASSQGSVTGSYTLHPFPPSAASRLRPPARLARERSLKVRPGSAPRPAMAAPACRGRLRGSSSIMANRPEAS